MMKSTTFNISKYLQLHQKTGLLLSILLWIYLVFRAYMVPFLHDEIASYWFYIDPGYIFPFTFKIDTNAANNHILNSFLSQIFSRIFGCTPFVLRLANLLFVPVYCFFAYKIADLLKNKYLALLFWLCLLFIHSIVEFLALSRGYGMSFALLSGCLWYLIKALKTKRTIDYLLTLIFLSGSISANLSLMSSGLIILFYLLMNIIIIKEPIAQKIIKLIIVLLSGIIPLTYFSLYSFAMQKGGALYYGQHNSFWSQTVSTLLKALFDNQGILLRILLIAYLVLIIFMTVKYLSKHFSFSVLQHSVLVFPILLIGNIIAVLLLDYFFNVNFPEDRTGFYFYYFFIASIFFLLDKFATSFDNTRLAWIALPLVLIPGHFIYAANLSHVAIYRDDRVPDSFYFKLKEKSESLTDLPTIGSYKGRTLVLAFKNYLNKGNVAKSHDSDYPSLIPDFQIVNTREFPKWNLYYHAIDYDKVSGYHLLERNHKLGRHTISTKKSISSRGNISDEYFNLAEGSVDTLTQSALYFEYNMDIESPAEPFIAWIVVSVSDTADKNVAYEYIALNFIKPLWKGDSKHYHNGQLVANLPTSAKKYTTYIWNMNKVSFSIDNATVAIKQLEKE
jgi:hypothetical protein